MMQPATANTPIAAQDGTAVPTLEIQNLTKFFGGLKAVNNFNLTVQHGALDGLIGPNGAGKTTVFNMITGLYVPTTGDIFLDGEQPGGHGAVRDHAVGHRPDVPEHPPVPDPDRAGQCAHRLPYPCRLRAVRWPAAQQRGSRPRNVS